MKTVVVIVKCEYVCNVYVNFTYRLANINRTIAQI